MKKYVAILITFLLGFAGCKKHTDNSTTSPPAAILTMTIDSVPVQFTFQQDTMVIQLDTQIGSAYSNPVQFSIPHKRMVFIATAADGSNMVWYINDYYQPNQDTCLRSVAYAPSNSSADFATVYGTKFYSAFSLAYYINSSPHRYFNADGGNITITSCNIGEHVVSGTFNVYTDNHDYPNEHHILQGTFTNIPFKTTVIPHYTQSITATVNGAQWAANGITTVIGKTNDYGIVTKGFRTSGVSINDNSEIEVVIFEAKNGEQGNCIRTTTFLDYKRSTDTIYSGPYPLVSNALINFITPDGTYDLIDSAKVQITSCDDASQTISGTFSYHGKTPNGTKTVNIINGVFTNLHYTVN